MFKTRVRKAISVLLSLMIILSLAACGNEASDASGTSVVTQQTASSTETKEATSTVAPDPLGKYETPIEISVVRPINANYKFSDGETYDNNVWIQGYEQELGIKLKYKWYVDASQYDQKIGLEIASNDLPDMFYIRGGDEKDLNILASNGVLADLTDVYNQYASPLLKSVVEFDQKSSEMLKYDGKMIALGMPSNIYEAINVIWIRNDWLKNVGLSAPKTMEDVLKISEAFTTKDPDKNGKNDTYGLAMFKDIVSTGFADTMGIFNGYHAYPKIWIKDSAGKLAYGSIQPEVKNALKVLQDMYKSGQIDKEFGVKDGGKAAELTTSGKVGMEFGAWWNPGWPLGDSKAKDINADWQAYPLVSSDSNPVLGTTSPSIGNYFCVNKNFKNPEAIVKLANYCLEKGFGKASETEFNKYIMSDDGKQLFDLSFIYMAPVDKNVQIMHSVSESVAAKDGSKLKGEEKSTFDSAMKWVNEKNPGNWVHYICFGSGDISAMSIIEAYQKNNSGMVNQFFGTPTPTMSDKLTTLQKMEIETYTNIIMGKSMDEFDKFVADWKKLGGDDITKEVNDWYEKNK